MFFCFLGLLPLCLECCESFVKKVHWMYEVFFQYVGFKRIQEQSEMLLWCDLWWYMCVGFFSVVTQRSLTQRKVMVLVVFIPINYIQKNPHYPQVVTPELLWSSECFIQFQMEVGRGKKQLVIKCKLFEMCYLSF